MSEYSSSGAWSVVSRDRHTVEVAAPSNPETRYRLQATRKDIRVVALVKEQPAEEIYLTRGMREYIVDFQVGDFALRLATSSDHEKDLMETHVLVNDEEFLVSSIPVEHGMRVAAVLKKESVPKAPLLKPLIDEMRGGGALMAEIQKSTLFGPGVLVRKEAGNGASAACAMECFLCALGYEFGCLACNLCVQMQMT